MAAQDYKSWLQANNLTSTKQNAVRWRNVMQKQPPFSYAGQVARDPLSIPYGGELLWQGSGKPNLQTLGQRGYGSLTPVQRPGGGWAVFGVNSDPMPDFARDQLNAITKRGGQVQQYAQQQVAPWLAQQTTALNNVQTQAQVGFANLIGQNTADLAGVAQQAGPGAAYADSAALAPFQAHEGLSNQLGADAAKSAAAGAAYQGSVDQLQGSNLAQGLQAGLAQQIAAIPDKYEQQRQQFMQQLTPVLLQIQENTKQGEAQRLQALDQRNYNRAQLSVEKQIAGMNAQVDLAGQAADQQAAQADATDKAVHDQFRTLGQIRGGLDQGQALLDNQGRGFAARPGIAKYHGRPVSWEQATDGSWYGVVGKKGGAAGSPSGTDIDNIYRSSTTRQRLAADLTSHWNGTAASGSTPAVAPWSGMHEPGVADAAARQVALWINGNKQFLARANGKLIDKDLAAFIQSTIPGLDYSRVRYYLNLVLAHPGP